MQPAFNFLANRKNGARYGVVRLVHVEFYERMTEAIQRERRVKKWKRAWKIQLIEKDNPDWDDLYLRLLW